VPAVLRLLRRGLVVAALVAAGAGIGVFGAAALREDGSKASARTAPLPAAVPPSIDYSPRAARGNRLQRPGTSVVAQAKGRSLPVFERPGRTRGRIFARRIDGQKLPLAVLVRGRSHPRGWVPIMLPGRARRPEAWVRRADVVLSANDFRARVELHRHRLLVWHRGKLIARAKIGVGQAVTPTPTGRYYVTDLLRPKDPTGLYGPYAFGLSAYSPVLTDFAGGNGQLGIHGTNEPQALGTDVSRGCVRVANSVITRLARTLPLGTPVTIVRRTPQPPHRKRRAAPRPPASWLTPPSLA